jgi:hypothetical protein
MSFKCAVKLVQSILESYTSASQCAVEVHQFFNIISCHCFRITVHDSQVRHQSDHHQVPRHEMYLSRCTCSIQIFRDNTVLKLLHRKVKFVHIKYETVCVSVLMTQPETYFEALGITFILTRLIAREDY